jgi:hypothetical protein
MLVPLAGVAQALPAGCAAGGIGITCTYTADTTFTVPAGVTSLDLRAIGGSGATGFSDDPGSGTPGAGGEGDSVADLDYATTPGTVLSVDVATSGAGNRPGLHGGGVGGNLDPTGDGAGCNNGGAGGGASSVQLNGHVITAAAGGAGGGGAFDVMTDAAGAGGAAGQSGHEFNNNHLGTEGHAGSAAGPGQGGAAPSANEAGNAGVGGVGGVGGLCGGGGGGGYFGGGGGSSNSGGGGGYSFGYTEEQLVPVTTVPDVSISYEVPAGAAPTITGFSPTSGPTGGGTVVTVTGTNFTDVTSVKFATNAGTSVNVLSATQLQVTSPAGTGDVAVSIVANGAGVTSDTGFTYTAGAAAPTITGISPTIGPVAGGTVVTVTGTNLSGVTSVDFDGIAGTAFTVISPTQLRVTSPASTVGGVSVPVTITVGGQGISSPTEFSYTSAASAPTITGFTPAAGPATGDTVVTVNGTNLTDVTNVTFGTAVGTALNVLSNTQLQITSPAGIGSVPIIATTRGGQSATSAASFIYTATQGQGQPPTITASVFSEQGRTNGWYTSPVTITFTCTPGSTPLASSCPAPLTLSTSKRGGPITAKVADTDGLIGSVKIGPFDIDSIAPSLQVKGATAGATYDGPRHLTCTASDTLSGVASCKITRRRHARGDVTTVIWTATAIDVAGNATIHHGSYHIHK